MRSPLDALVTEKSLFLISTSRNADLLDLIVDGRLEGNIPLKNVCAKVTPQLAARIDEVVDLLGVSKRRFLEAAFVEAVERAHQIMKAEGVWEVLGEDVAPGKAGGEVA
jgi:flavin-binding protein dodecin